MVVLGIMVIASMDLILPTIFLSQVNAITVKVLARKTMEANSFL
jgi:hypothetical protein